MPEEFEAKGSLALAAGGEGGSGGPREPCDPKFRRTSLKRIGDGLRAMYDQRLREPVPQEWKEILKRIDTAQM
jgi:hypothetical protein